MEEMQTSKAGWLEKKWKGGMVRRWEKNWVELRGSFLAYFEDQPKQGSDKNLEPKGIISLKDARAQLSMHHHRTFCFEISHPERRSVIFDAVSEDDKYEWLQFILVAAKGPVNPPKHITSYFAELDLPRNADLVQVKQAYRRLALKHHPDRRKHAKPKEPTGVDTTDPDFQFKKISEAYEVIRAVLETKEEERSAYNEIAITLARGRPRGLGISMQSKGNPPLSRITVHTVVQGGQAHRKGVKQHDIIVNVDGRGVRGLPFQDVLLCIDGPRVKVGTEPPDLQLVLLRKKAHSGLAEEQTATKMNKASKTKPTPKRNLKLSPTAGGWLDKKWESGALVRRWEQQWVVLEGSFLKCFEAIDANDEPRTLLCTIPVKDCRAETFTHHTREHTFRISHPERRGVFLSCSDAESMLTWMRAIWTVALGPVNAPVTVADYYIILGIQPPQAAELYMSPDTDHAILEPSELLRKVRVSYRKKALRLHPDKGGDHFAFAKLAEAYEVVTAVLETMIEEKSSRDTDATLIEVTLKHGDKGLGLGLIPVGQPPLCQTTVKKVNADSEADVKGIKVDDVIVGVDGVGVRGISMNQVLQRLKGAGAPIVQIVLLRRQEKRQTENDSATEDETKLGTQEESTHRKQSWMHMVKEEIAANIKMSPKKHVQKPPQRRKKSWMQTVSEEIDSERLIRKNGVSTVAEQEHEKVEVVTRQRKQSWIDRSDATVVTGGQSGPPLERVEESPEFEYEMSDDEAETYEGVMTELRGQLDQEQCTGSVKNQPSRKMSWLDRIDAKVPCITEPLEPQPGDNDDFGKSQVLVEHETPMRTIPEFDDAIVIMEELGDKVSGTTPVSVLGRKLSWCYANTETKMAHLDLEARLLSKIDQGSDLSDSSGSDTDSNAGNSITQMEMDSALQKIAHRMGRQYKPLATQIPSTPAQSPLLMDSDASAIHSLELSGVMHWRVLWAESFGLLYLRCRHSLQPCTPDAEFRVSQMEAVLSSISNVLDQIENTVPIQQQQQQQQQSDNDCLLFKPTEAGGCGLCLWRDALLHRDPSVRSRRLQQCLASSATASQYNTVNVHTSGCGLWDSLASPNELCQEFCASLVRIPLRQAQPIPMNTLKMLPIYFEAESKLASGQKNRNSTTVVKLRPDSTDEDVSTIKASLNEFALRFDLCQS